ncbi:hypothetical protein CH330_04195 [candidate division WOR-3 bacterium JGI_Cruoil_03_51_56]|uniref:BFN domain-containing protein n=1 Tax=candidate division WOR-3 bacterium JGI_Cruoil_03_51_56 TaxID=1973747 RepID=A0A235BUM5_UNCW3|nr:MAG: hypothetical protein CH330_04195 [candidate division WOR-3 bacterium JGI_Cruoil_03_51_56]
MTEVKVDALLIDNTNNSPVVLLRELNGDRILPIYIGPFEASAIAYALQATKFPRPMTLDLMQLTVQALGGQVYRVIVTKIEQNTYYAELIIKTHSRLITVDARPSDSIGLALRTKAPIFVSEDVMDKASQVVSVADEEKLKELRSKLRNIEPEEFGNYKM